jgi:alginate O-acetyltransferase complex protein AlgJ
MVTESIDPDRPEPLDREAIARIEVGHTNVSPAVARVLVGWFLLMLAVLPLTETVGGTRARDVAGPWKQLAGIPDAIDRRLAELKLRVTGGDGEEPSAWSRLVTANRAVLERMNAFETALEDQSAVGRALRPQAQRILSGWLGAGNERVYIGRDRWLFYRPDVEYLTGHGFLDPLALDRRSEAASEYESLPQPDPRPAIRQFARDLEARGITLVLVPTPVKPTVHPGELARTLEARSDLPMHNQSYAAFVDQMRHEGLLVFDPSSEMARMRAAGAPQYLLTDTHWRPEAMQRVAEALAAFVQQHVTLTSVASPGYEIERREAQHAGDTAAMLDLPPEQTLYPAERVTLGFVVDGAGDPWRPSRDADVLVLGDSFSNMYSLATMGWGEAAGLVEHFSYALQRPVDRIVQNDDGAHASRDLLRRDVGGAVDRLAGKRVVVWQFAARELAFGDWKIIAIPPAAP